MGDDHQCHIVRKSLEINFLRHRLTKTIVVKKIPLGRIDYRTWRTPQMVLSSKYNLSISTIGGTCFSRTTFSMCFHGVLINALSTSSVIDECVEVSISNPASGSHARNVQYSVVGREACPEPELSVAERTGGGNVGIQQHPSLDVQSIPYFCK